jgi:pilus assembly protein CpaC
VGRSGTFLGRTLTAEPRFVETTLMLWGPGNEVDVHSLTVGDFINQQVMLEVTVAEVNRTALEEHGIDFRVVQEDLIAAGFMGGGIPTGLLNTVPPQQNSPLLPLAVGEDAPTYAFIFTNENVTAFIKALETEGLATILAQPKLLALSGQNAVFQVGGEIPIRIASGFAADIEFKPFGTLVNFVPRVSEEGDIVLTVTPEVSEPDFSNTVEGIPTFRTRRASTTARLRSSQTLILGGLLQTVTQEEVAGVPYAKDIPIVGYVFRQTRYVKEVRELLVSVRPLLVRPIPAGEEIPLPTTRGPLTREEVRTKDDPAEVTRPRIPFVP